MGKKLMLITISGVQEFISNARKTADFYNSSHIIAGSLREIYTVIKNEKNIVKNFSLILPQKMDHGDIPNYFLSEFNSDRSNDEIEEKIREYLIQKIKGELKYLDLNVYIVVVDDRGSYKEAYNNLYEKLDGYKNNKFKDHSLIDSKYKTNLNNSIEKFNCTICGINKGQYISDKNKYIKYKNLYTEKSDIRLVSEEEIICESCFKKRKSISYPSTIDIAVMEWVQIITADKERKKQLKFYEEKIEEKYKKECISKFYQIDRVQALDKDLEEIFKKLNNIGEDKNIKASRYYALVRADIDDLGKHFSGKYLVEENDLKCFQKKLSNKISEFATNVGEYINKEFDKRLSIYLGGDDLLFFCPLHKLFPMFEFINAEFDKISTKLCNRYNKNLTLSKSIVISHDSIPLKQVIKLSMVSLENAKEKFKDDGKNALAISIINSSYTVRTSSFKNKDGNIKIIKNLIYGFKKDISSSLISNLERQVSLLGESMIFEEYEILMNVIINEIKRIGKRKINNNEENRKLEYIYNLKELVIEFVKRSPKNDFKIDLKEYFNLLHIIDKISSEIITDLKNTIEEGEDE